MIIFSTGEKGGVGKSTHSTMLLDILRGAGIKVAAFDSDRVNSTLTKLYCQRDEEGKRLPEQDIWRGVNQINMDNPRAITRWSDSLKAINAEGHVLLDLPAGVEGALEFIRPKFRFDKFFEAEKLPWMLLFSFCGGDDDSEGQFDGIIEEYGKTAKIAVVTSDRFGADIFYESDYPDLIKSIGGVICHVPKWPDYLMSKIKKSCLPYSTMIKPGHGLTMAETIQAEGYWLDTVEGFQPLIKLLGA